MRILAIVIPLALGTPAAAQVNDQQSGPPSRTDNSTPDQWTVTLGIAPVVSPAWEGSDKVVLSIFPDVRINYGDEFFASIPDGAGWNAVNADGWKAGPLAKLRFGRDEDGSGSPFAIAGKSDALIGLGDINASAELGAFVEKRFGAHREWNGRVEVLRGFGGHEGLMADFSLSYQLRAGRTIISAGPRATLATDNFTRTYFGIDADQSARSGLSRYRPDGGLVSYGIGGTIIHPINRQSAMTLFSNFRMLGEVAANSPLIEERGRPEQFSVGIGYGFRFGL